MTDEPEMPPTLAKLDRAMKVVKTRAVRQSEDGQVAHLIDVYRAGERVLRVAATYAEDCLEILYNAPGATCADYIAMAVDSWGASQPTNPITGKTWEFGDMDSIARNDLGVERGLVREAISLFGFERDGTEQIADHPYTHDRAARKITWSEPRVGKPSGVGRFPRVAREGFARPTMAEEMVARLGPPPDGMLDDLIRKTSVSYALRLGPDIIVLEGPKGPPLDPDAIRFGAMMS